MTKSGPRVYKVWRKVGVGGGIKEISLGNNNHHRISVAAKIILLSLVGCLTSRMGVNPLTFFYLVCVKTADYLLPTHVLAFRRHEQQTRDAFFVPRAFHAPTSKPIEKQKLSSIAEAIKIA